MADKTPAAPAGRVLRFLRRYGYLMLCFLSLFGGACWFRWMYCPGAAADWDGVPVLLDLGWSLLFTAVAAALPRWGKRVWLGLLGLAFLLLPIVHGVYVNMFRKFFSFADLAFAGDGFTFLDPSYLMLRKLALLLGGLCFLLMAAAAALAPGDEPPLFRLIFAAAGALAGLGLVFGVWSANYRSSDIIWDMETDPAYIYETFSDTRTVMEMVGLYHYTFRDVQLTLFPGGGVLSLAERGEIASFAAARSHPDNEMTGLLAGKNLLLVQLEAIDTWMLDGYMPVLRSLKERSVSFANHYTPAYITAGTFNTEFMVNTGLLPATPGTSASVYSRNRYPYSLAHLLAERGYAVNSFHSADPEVYDRARVHENFGYVYHSGRDMGMDDVTMDSDLAAAFDDMTADAPFFSFIITFSGHGPYGEDNPIYQAHAEAARARAARTDGLYVYAVAHAMETDLFVRELMDYLDARGLLDSTAVVFYADHFNYYMLDDKQCMDIKGVDSLNMLQHTDWFIYDRGLAPRVVEKYTSSIDVLPTLTNLFGLETDYGLMAGDDAFSDGGGYVIFNDNTWTGTGRDVSAEIARRRRINSLLLSGDYWG